MIFVHEERGASDHDRPGQPVAEALPPERRVDEQHPEAHAVTGALSLLRLVGLYLVVLGVLRIIDYFARPPQAQAA